MNCSFLSTEVDKVECFKECPFFPNTREEGKCPFSILEKSTRSSTYKKRAKSSNEDYEYLLSIYDNYNI